MLVFFDTEFTQFRDGQLLSVGLVADDDKHLYLEISDPKRHAQASSFCQEVVLTQFGLVKGAAVTTDTELGHRLADWLERFGEPLVLASDYKLDRYFLERALEGAGRWSKLAPAIAHLDVAELASTPECLAAQEAYFATSGLLMQHHALVDAFALRARWRAR